LAACIAFGLASLFFVLFPGMECIALIGSGLTLALALTPLLVPGNITDGVMENVRRFSAASLLSPCRLTRPISSPPSTVSTMRTLRNMCAKWNVTARKSNASARKLKSKSLANYEVFFLNVE
jgi:hypothetical protein